MTGMLASVTSVEEAMIVLAEQVDIIDLKNPRSGSLGKLEVGLIASIVAEIGGRCLTSATIGDLPMVPSLISKAVAELSETGVDFVKVGFFPDGESLPVINRLSTLSEKTALIAVLFADINPDFHIIDKLLDAGFKGILLDTMDKSRGSLTKIMVNIEIKAFVNQVKSRNLMCGLAGSLRLDDIPGLLKYHPHYLGFRGALCDGLARTSGINAPAVRQVRKLIAD